MRYEIDRCLRKVKEYIHPALHDRYFLQRGAESFARPHDDPGFLARSTAHFTRGLELARPSEDGDGMKIGSAVATTRTTGTTV